MKAIQNGYRYIQNTLAHWITCNMKDIQNEHKDTLAHKITCVIPMDTGIFLSHTAEKSVLKNKL